MTSKLIMNRRTLLKGAAASGLILPATGLYTPALAQSNRERVIFATTQEPVQFNPLGRRRQGQLHPQPRRRTADPRERRHFRGRQDLEDQPQA